MLEFIADEGRIYIPYWMMQNLMVEEGGMVQVLYTIHQRWYGLDSISIPISILTFIRLYMTTLRGLILIGLYLNVD